VRQNSPDKDQKKEEGAVNSLRGLERWERRRRSRSAPATCGGGWCSDSGAVHRERRRGEGCEVMRERCSAFIGRRRGRGGGVEVVAQAQRPAAIDDEGLGGAAVLGGETTGRPVGVRGALSTALGRERKGRGRPGRRRGRAAWRGHGEGRGRPEVVMKLTSGARLSVRERGREEAGLGRVGQKGKRAAWEKEKKG
jgi:hypothetical protein